ncbi:MAG: N-acetylneuraminate synthase family protein [Gaiella sp.]
MRELVIGGRRIADDTENFVIAELGHNHQGDLDKARDLIRIAAECGVDAVKLQKRDNRSLYTRAFYDSPYDNEASFGPTYGAHREALELDGAAWDALIPFARERGMMLFATAFDPPSGDFLAERDVPAFKIASGDLRNLPFLRQLAGYGRPLLLSTGGGTLEQVERAVDAIGSINPALALLQCTAAYPVEVEELNLRVIETYRERFPELVVGLSDHHNGIAMTLVAHMLGARIVEKHFTLNHAWKGTDHAFSLMPDGMRRLVRDLRRIESALGDGVKQPFASESKPLEKMGKKLVAARDLPAGHVLAEGDLVARSPADEGLAPSELERLLGGTLGRPLQRDEALVEADVMAFAAREV